MAYYRGSTLRIELTTADPDDLTTLVDPSGVVVTLEAPDGTISAPGVSRTGLGAYVFAFIADQVGMWTWVVEATGTYAGVQPGVVNIQALPTGL